MSERKEQESEFCICQSLQPDTLILELCVLRVIGEKMFHPTECQAVRMFELLRPVSQAAVEVARELIQYDLLLRK